MTPSPLEKTPVEVADELLDYYIVDVREASEFDGPLGHITGAHWIPLSALEARVEALPRERPILMVCRSGNRSGKACEWLAGWGRPGAVNLVGGMIAWHEDGLPIVRDRSRNVGAVLDAFAAWLSQVTRVPLEDAAARAHDAMKAESVADEFASPSTTLVRALTRLEQELRSGANVPADLGLVCEALRADAKTLDSDAVAENPSGGKEST